jgi:hypothetical protein
MSTAWSYRFPYWGGDEVHVRRLSRARAPPPPPPHAVAADALFASWSAVVDDGGRARGDRVAARPVIRCGRGVRRACEAWKSGQVLERSNDSNPLPFLPLE